MKIARCFFFFFYFTSIIYINETRNAISLLAYETHTYVYLHTIIYRLERFEAFTVEYDKVIYTNVYIFQIENINIQTHLYRNETIIQIIKSISIFIKYHSVHFIILCVFPHMIKFINKEEDSHDKNFSN